MSGLLKTILMLLTLAIMALPWAAQADDGRTVTDMRGREVHLPADLKKVATIDDGFVEGVMTHLGVIDKVAAVATNSIKWEYRFEYMRTPDECGFNTMRVLNPWLVDLPNFGGRESSLNFETLAKVEPDIVIMRLGDCTMGKNEESIGKAIATIESLGLPLLVLQSPSSYDQADLSSLKNEIMLLGEVFGRREKAAALADYLADQENFIRERTKDIPGEQKSRVLYIGLNPDARKKGAAGLVFGVNTPESYIIEQVAGARNAFSHDGFGLPLSLEQVYALDPDVLVLPASLGYHAPRELYEAPYFSDMTELRAIKNRRVYPMPFTPYNCARRLEYLLDMLVIAKAAYPERFKDFSVYEFALGFYQKLYGVDADTAKSLRSAQFLDWMGNENF